MAATWTALAQAVVWASAKSMIDVFNATGTVRVIRVYRVFIHQISETAVGANLVETRLRRITSATGGSTVTPVKRDTNSSALDANTTCGTGRTVSSSDVFRRFLYLVEEPTVTGTTMANWECLIPNAEVWNAGYADSNIEPITCRETQGLEVYGAEAVTSSSNDFELEFTDGT